MLAVFPIALLHSLSYYLIEYNSEATLIFPRWLSGHILTLMELCWFALVGKSHNKTVEDLA